MEVVSLHETTPIAFRRTSWILSMIQCFNYYKHESSVFDKGIPHVEYSCRTLESHNQMPRTMHKHKNILEIILVTSGDGIHMIGDRRFETKKGDVLIYNAGILHDEIAQPGENLSVYCLGLSNLFLPDKPPNHLTDSDSTPVFDSGDSYEGIVFIFDRIHDLIVKKRHFGGELINGFTQTLLYMILELEHTAARSHSDDSEHILIRRTREFIDKNYSEQISLTVIARELGVSPHYLSHLFKNAEGHSLMQFVIRRRIGEAQSLLINSNDSITSIAFQVGYNNSNHFHTIFQKIVGLTPQQYRKYWIAEQARL